MDNKYIVPTLGESLYVNVLHVERWDKFYLTAFRVTEGKFRNRPIQKEKAVRVMNKLESFKIKA